MAHLIRDGANLTAYKIHALPELVCFLEVTLVVLNYRLVVCNLSILGSSRFQFYQVLQTCAIAIPIEVCQGCLGPVLFLI